MKLTAYEELCVKSIFLVVDAETPPEGTHIRRTCSDDKYDRFFYNIGASALQKWDGGSITVESEDVVFIPRKLCYTDDILSHGNSLIAYIDSSMNDITGIHKWSFPDNHEIRRRFISLLNIWNQKKSGYYIQCMTELYMIFSIIWRSEKLRYVCSASAAAVDPAVDYMKEHFSDPELKIPELAKICEMSYSHFRKVFCDVNKMSADAYLQKLRLEHSRKLLELGDYSVSETAALSGFSDVYYFSSFFKKFTGVKPSEYRRKTT